MPNLDGSVNGITEIEKNVSGIECGDILKWNDPEFVRKYQEEYRKKHKRKAKNYNRKYCQLHSEDIKRHHHKYHEENKDRIHKQKRRYYQQNKIRIRRKNIRNRNYRNAYSKVYYKKNKPQLIAATCRRFKRRYKTDILFRVKHLLRTRIGDLCKGRGYIKSRRTMELLGCDLKTFKAYIEALFVPGMNWSNHGKWGWHIDHIVPLVHAKNQQEMETLCYYKNLQPLWWYDNLSKSGNAPLTNK